LTVLLLEAKHNLEAMLTFIGGPNKKARTYRAFLFVQYY
jgi:hypothetical protein